MATERTRSPRGEGGRLRDDLVAAATEMLVGRGPEPDVSLRAVARRAGVAPSAVYLWFPSQADLVAAVLEAQFDRLRQALATVDDITLPPPERLGRIAHAYVAWALERPGAYRLLFERPDPESAEHGPGADLLERVEALLAAQDPTAPAADRARRLWAALHGLASLQIHKEDPAWRAHLDGDVDVILGLHLGAGIPAPGQPG